MIPRPPRATRAGSRFPYRTLFRAGDGRGGTGSGAGSVSRGGRSRRMAMARAAAKLTRSPSRDIPLDRLALSQSNGRRIKAGVSIETLADDIARRGLLQSLSVRPLLDAEGQETGR